MRKILLAALLGLAAVNLSGCFPVVAVGIGAGAMMADDRRSSGTYLVDEENEWKVSGRIHDAFGKNVHVNVTSFNRRVLLTGEVPDAATRAKVEEIARGVHDVREIQDELIIGPVSSLGSRTNDSFITAKVKSRFLDDKRFQANQVKVVTEDDTVYLMGLVKHSEGDAAAEVAARTKGVGKVVKVFEYID
jgi:osmotically-inducible protein OsmY